ncbi:MAG: protein kinase [Anaerolineae bacterium]|nr:protein kinase [Anaerolineae bacterium]
MSRRDDLEAYIRDSYDIIREYEREVQFADQPEKCVRARRELDKHWNLVHGYLDEYTRLTHSALPPELNEIAAHFGFPQDVVEYHPALKSSSDIQAEPTQTPKKIGKYQIIDTLGKGSMAYVYKAYHPNLKRHVAIKVLHSQQADNVEFLDYFRHEAAAIARLRHPNIVQVYDADSEGDLHYMVMELVEGTTLKDELDAHRQRGETFPFDLTVRVIGALSDAIDCAHSRGIIHRDLKPANIMFTPEGQVVLADFGIARIIDAARETNLDFFFGTPAYTSPEQAEGKPGDARSDIYALGVILYEMVTGHLPFSGEPYQVLLKHLKDPLPLPRTFKPDVPLAVEQVILKTLQKAPDDRYQTANDLRHALEQATQVRIELTTAMLLRPVFQTQSLDTMPIAPQPNPLDTPVANVGAQPPARNAPFQAPADNAQFVGRRQELADFLRMMIRSQQQNTTCLAGMGGIGKTSLAIHIAHQLRDRFVDGVLWANARTSDPLAIIDSWARAYDCDFSGLPDLASRATALRGILADKRLLLILDDVQSIEQVQLLVPGSSHCITLLTTRDLALATALNVHIYPLSALNPLESRQLLIRLLGEERVMSEKDAADEICDLLGHLPLAVEIVAQRLASRKRWPLADLAERLRDETRRLSELQISDHQVRASFESSLDTLDESLRHSFALLGVFEGRPFTLNAFVAVAGLDRWMAEDDLYALLALSLVGEFGETHYRQHPLLADFAREQLAHARPAYERMVRYYLDYAVAHQKEYALLDQEWDNLMAGMKMAYEQELWPVVIEYAEALTDIWFAWGRLSDARRGLEWAIKATIALENISGRALFTLQKGRACIRQGDYDQAESYLGQSRTLYDQIKDASGEINVIYELAEIAAERGQFDRAHQMLIQGLERLNQDIPDHSTKGAILYKLADTEYAQGHFQQAQDLAQEAFEIRKTHNDCTGEIQTLRLLADIAISCKDYSLAETFCNQALTACESIQEKREMALVLYSLATVHYYGHRFKQTGNLELAKEYADQSLHLFTNMGDQRSQAQVLWRLSQVEATLGACDSALDKGQQSFDLCVKLQDLWGQIFLLSHLGDLYLGLARPTRAYNALNAALELVGEGEHPLKASLLDRLKQLSEHPEGAEP